MHSLFRTLGVTVLLTMAITTFSCRASEQGSSATTAQTNGRTGTLSGTVSDHLGVAVANAPIQAKNKATGMVAARALSSADGRYTLAIAPGTYEL